MDIHALLIQIQEARRKLDGADVQLNHRLERENRLLDSMKRQNRQARQEMMKKYGVPFKPADPKKIPKPINFRAEPDVQAEAVEARYKRLKKAQDKKIASDPRVGLHGPSHPMFHRSDLAKRVRQLAKQLQMKKTNEDVDIQGLLRKHKAGKKIGVTNLNRLKARGLVARESGKHKGKKKDLGNRGKS